MPAKRIAPTVDTARARATQDAYRQTAGAPADAELVRLPLEQIGDRPAGDTRPITPEQVAALAESIATLGLIQPLAVDAQGRLLAGGHRRAALQQLQEQDLPRFNDLFPGGVPCRKFAFDSAAAPEQALAVEISENEKRRNYTRAEIVAVVERCASLGANNRPGPKDGPGLTTLVAQALGVNKRTVERALRAESATAVADSAPTTRSLRLPADVVERVQQLARERGQSAGALIAAALDALQR